MTATPDVAEKIHSLPIWQQPPHGLKVSSKNSFNGFAKTTWGLTAWLLNSPPQLKAIWLKQDYPVYDKYNPCARDAENSKILLKYVQLLIRLS